MTGTMTGWEQKIRAASAPPVAKAITDPIDTTVGLISAIVSDKMIAVRYPTFAASERTEF